MRPSHLRLALATFADHAAIAIAYAPVLRQIEQLKERLERKNTYLREDVAAATAPDGIIGGSPALRNVIEQVAIVAPTTATVLIQGESGTGKELVARAIHDRSPRRHRALISVNCASIPRELFESEFFGHVKGAFTARCATARQVQAADGGTLFLDEVGEIPLISKEAAACAARRCIRTRRGRDNRRVDVRVIARGTGTFNKKSPPVISAATCSTASACFRSCCHRSASEPMTFPPRDPLPRAGRTALRPAWAQTQCARDQNVGGIRVARKRSRTATRPRTGRAAVAGRCVAADSALGEPEETTRAKSNESTPGALPPVIPEIEWRRRERENLGTALQLAKGRIYGPDGAAGILGVKPTTLISRLNALGLREPPKHPRRRKDRA